MVLINALEALRDIRGVAHAKDARSGGGFGNQEREKV